MNAKLHEGMTRAHASVLEKLRDDVRFRVLERAALIQEATGCSWLEADERALAEEAGVPTQKTIGGM